MIPWTEIARLSFLDAKSAVTDATLIVYPKLYAPTRLQVDASNFLFGSVLQQYQKIIWVNLSFLYKKLQLAETLYSAFSHELVAIYLAVRHFFYFLVGCTFHIFTDHKSLIFAVQSNSERYSSREAVHL